MKYLISVAYDGSKFYGFQRLKGHLTVQKKIEEALSIIAKEKIEIKRFTNLSYLLWQKHIVRKYILFKSRKYCKYRLVDKFFNYLYWYCCCFINYN